MEEAGRVFRNLEEGVVAWGEGCWGLDALKVLGRGINSRLIAPRRERRARGERERPVGDGGHCCGQGGAEGG